MTALVRFEIVRGSRFFGAVLVPIGCVLSARTVRIIDIETSEFNFGSGRNFRVASPSANEVQNRFFGRREGRLVWFRKAAFPYDEDSPAGGEQRGDRIRISIKVGFEFSFPEQAVARRSGCLSAAGVPVPKTTMHKDRYFTPPKNQVRTTRKIGYVKLGTKPLTTKDIEDR
jgi:hypothetical protein